MGIWYTGANWTGVNRIMASGTISGNDCYNNSSSGIQIDGAPPYLTISNDRYWRNGSEGVIFGNYTNYGVTLSGLVLFGNASQNIQIGVETGDLLIKDCVLNGETSFGTTRGVYAGVNVAHSKLSMVNCDLSQTVAHSIDFGFNNIPMLDWTIVNCSVGAATVVQSFSGSANFNIPYPNSIVRFQRYNRTAGDHRTFQAYCNTKTDTVIYKTTSPSERITPRESSSLLKSKSASKKRTVDSGQTATVGVWVRKSTSTDSGGANYNGNQIRLICKANHAIGITADTVVATGSAAVGTWEQLTGNVGPTSGDAGVLEFYVDCDGTAGWINADDWTITAA